MGAATAVVLITYDELDALGYAVGVMVGEGADMIVRTTAACTVGIVEFCRTVCNAGVIGVAGVPRAGGTKLATRIEPPVPTYPDIHCCGATTVGV